MTFKAQESAKESARLLRFFPVAPFTPRSKRCLNATYRAAGCTRCQSSCPLAAITVDDNLVDVDRDACIRCGVCVAVCPTGALVEDPIPEDRLVSNAELDDKALELACPLAVRPTAGGGGTVSSRVKDATARPTPRCLAALQPATLLALSQLGRREVWLNDEACARCPIGAVQGQLHSQVREANGWLEVVGRPAAIRTYTEDSTYLQPRPDQRSLVGAPGISRRRLLFPRFGAPSEDEPVGEGGPPRSRLRLLALLRTRRQQVAVGDNRHLPITAIKVDQSACSGCAFCTRICPTGALRWESDESEEIFALYFRPAHCIDCGLCAIACPEQAMVYHDTGPDAATLLDERPLRLHADRLTTCRSCRAKIAANGPYDICFICRQRGQRPAYLWSP